MEGRGCKRGLQTNFAFFLRDFFRVESFSRKNSLQERKNVRKHGTKGVKHGLWGLRGGEGMNFREEEGRNGRRGELIGWEGEETSETDYCQLRIFLTPFLELSLE